jgi:NAD(P)-dependent dehydrogenase (short-subunit alcohol dehydrogenase family)
VDTEKVGPVADLDGKVAIVTGAAGNIGSETCVALAEAGAKVVLVDMEEEGLTAGAAALERSGFEVLSCVADVAEEADVVRVVRRAIDVFGGIDILDNNAGGTMLTATQGDGDVTTMRVDLWDRLMAVNLRGPMLFCKHTIPSMVERGGGSIINISSGTSLAGNDAYTAYACSKGGLNTLTRYVATSHGADGVRCNALALGIVGPADTSNLPELVDSPYLAHKLVGRIGVPRDVADMVVFLASSRSSYITGQVISVDGGFYAHQPTFVQPHPQTA